MKTSNIVELFKNMATGEKRKRIIVAALLLGIALIFLSEIHPPKKQVEIEKSLSNLEYAQYIEDRLCELIESIDGVENAKVMVTLENGAEYVYANETNIKRDRTEDMGDNTTKQVQSLSSENKFILVETDSGRKTALVKTQIEPVIKGVAIVCSGRGGAVVEKDITDAVTTVLGIGANQVSISKLK